ncbi:MAG: hypothetical protein VCC00_04720 [Deltaproteobacteria bacterium]
MNKTTAPTLGAPARPDAIDGWLTLLVFVVAVLWQLPFFDRWLGLLDEGYILAIATDINRGDLLYRDIYIDGPMPLAFETLAAWFRATGPSVLASRWLAMLVFGVYTAATYRVSREALARGPALAFVVFLLCWRVWSFPHWQVYSYSAVSAALLLVAAAILANALRRDSSRLRLFAGFFLGLGVLAKQNYGGLVAIAFGLLLLALPWLEGRKRPSLREALGPAWQLTAGALLIALPVLGVYVYAGAGEQIFHQTLLFPISMFDDQFYTLLPDLQPFFAQDTGLRQQIGSYFPSLPATLWWKDCAGCFAANINTGGLYEDTALFDILLKLVYWSPLVFGVFATCVVLARAARARREGLSEAMRGQLLVLALGLGFLAAFSKPRDWVHLMMIYPPVLLAALMAGQAALARWPAFLPRAAAGLLYTGLILLLASTLAMVLDMRRVFDHYLAFERGQVYADRQNGPLIDAVVAWQKQNIATDRPLPSWPTQPALVFLSGRATVGGYHVIWPGQNPARDGVLREALEQRDVNHMLFSISQWGHLGAFASIAPEFHADLVRDWEIEHIFSLEPVGPIVAALRRRGPTAPATPLLALAPHAFAQNAWPFGQVLHQPVESAAAPRGVALHLVVPAEQPILRLQAGLNPNRWFGAPVGPFDFRIERRTAHGWATLSQIRLHPRLEVRDRRWIPIAIDLSQQAGQPIELRFTITAEGLYEEATNLAGWREPAFYAAAQ